MNSFDTKMYLRCSQGAVIILAALLCCLGDDLGEIPSLRSFLAKRPEIESSLGMLTFLSASRHTSQRRPGLCSSDGAGVINTHIRECYLVKWNSLPRDLEVMYVLSSPRGHIYEIYVC